MKTALIYQPCGLGDILFLQKIARNFVSAGYQVYWPVVHEFKWLSDYIPDINFVSWGDEAKHLTGPPLPDSVVFPYKEYYSPNTPTSMPKDDLIFFQGFINVSPIMAGKYNSVHVDWRDWRDYIKFNRNTEKENQLFYDVLGLKDDEEFKFVNRMFCMRPKIEIDTRIPVLTSPIKVVELDVYKDFSLFDWCKVFEKAKRIDMIETSLNYLFESPQLFETMKTKELNLYSRHNNFSEVSYLFNLPWNYKYA